MTLLTPCPAIDPDSLASGPWGPWITLAGLSVGLLGVWARGPLVRDSGAAGPRFRDETEPAWALPARVLGKLTGSAGFLVLAFEMGLDRNPEPLAQGVLAALTLSALGDLALLAPGRGRGFCLGLGAFFCAHLSYAWALGSQGLSWPRTAASLVVLAPIALAFDLWLSRSAPAAWLVWVRAYSLALAAMAASAAGSLTPRGGPWLLGGAAAFLISDLWISRERFGVDDRWNLALGWPLYFGAQLSLAYGTGKALTF